MNKIEVKILNEATSNPSGMQLFLAKLTQRGHSISDMEDLQKLYNSCLYPSQPRTSKAIIDLAAMPHGTIKRFSPITIAIVGASRRFLSQARTHQVGIDFVSGSLQYSDFSDSNQFVVPYALMEASKRDNINYIEEYLSNCQDAMATYKAIAQCADNDTAGYIAPQGLRNVLIIQGNHQSLDYFIRLRACNRNTMETQYVALRIWEELLRSTDGEELFAYAGPDCVYGKCREGKMFCGNRIDTLDEKTLGMRLPRAIIETKFPLLKEQDNAGKFV